jgi:hypothetical protein
MVRPDLCLFGKAGRKRSGREFRHHARSAAAGAVNCEMAFEDGIRGFHSPRRLDLRRQPR